MTYKSTENPHINNQRKQLVYLSAAKDAQLYSVCLTAQQLNTKSSHTLYNLIEYVLSERTR